MYIAHRAVGHLGSGQFGSVKQGVWKRQGTRPVDVALKSLTKTSEEDKVKFLQEAAIMAQFRHPNVILLYGVIAKEDPVSNIHTHTHVAVYTSKHKHTYISTHEPTHMHTYMHTCIHTHTHTHTRAQLYIGNACC